MLLIAALPQVLRLRLNDEHPQSETGNETTETISKSLFSAGFHVKLTPMKPYIYSLMMSKLILLTEKY
jgi:hypothetical protein